MRLILTSFDECGDETSTRVWLDDVLPPVIADEDADLMAVAAWVWQADQPAR